MFDLSNFPQTDASSLEHSCDFSFSCNENASSNIESPPIETEYRWSIGSPYAKIHNDPNLSFTVLSAEIFNDFYESRILDKIFEQFHVLQTSKYVQHWILRRIRWFRFILMWHVWMLNWCWTRLKHDVFVVLWDNLISRRRTNFSGNV